MLALCCELTDLFQKVKAKNGSVPTLLSRNKRAAVSVREEMGKHGLEQTLQSCHEKDDKWRRTQTALARRRTGRFYYITLHKRGVVGHSAHILRSARSASLVISYEKANYQAREGSVWYSSGNVALITKSKSFHIKTRFQPSLPYIWMESRLPLGFGKAAKGNPFWELVALGTEPTRSTIPDCWTQVELVHFLPLLLGD